ncbi:GGDEF domain-containing protein [Achromobacter insolitus]|uniref:GGDEF domain-containing protein n=1 Tax=Achromobacter insolitus TaxID=217204 RepID=UPI0028AA5713|nr:diguanylate cyclase [Achromobacter insolitus]
MFRNVFALKSLERYFLTLAAGVALPVSMLTVIVVQQNWRSLTATDDAMRGFVVVRTTLMTMEAVSAERGPMNAALGSDLPVPENILHLLDEARQRTNAQMADLLALYRAPLNPNGAREFTNIQRIRQSLLDARASADNAIAAPRANVSGHNLWTVVGDMVALVPELRAAMSDGIGLVARNQGEDFDLLSLALLAGELREQAGLVGSTFAPALSKRRTLTTSDQLRIERVIGRIDELRALIEANIASMPQHAASPAYRELQQQYFGAGMNYLDSVRAIAERAPEDSLVSMYELGANYVPQMKSIVQFRDLMLDAVEQRIGENRKAAIRVLLTTLAAAAMLTAALVLGLAMFRKRVIRPFVRATNIIGAIARGGEIPPIPADQYRGEVNSMFKALNVLNDNATAVRKLELERDRLIQDLAIMAETDFLTGLLNRRAFEKRLEAALGDVRHSDGEGLAFILFDIDHFKSINDTHGHATGDEALRTVADLCRKTFRESDVVARVGGEEFAVLCRSRSPARVYDVAERMRINISNTQINAGNGARFGMTASFGVAHARGGDAAALDSLSRRADELLYKAKLNGRNCVLLEQMA